MISAVKWLASAFMVVVLGSQIFVGFTYHGRTRWPIISYPMYSGSKTEGARFDDHTVHIISENGARTRIDPDVYGMAYWIFKKNIVAPGLRGRADRLQPLIDAYCERTGEQAQRLEIFDIGVTIERNGPAFGNPKEWVGVDVSCAA